MNESQRSHVSPRPYASYLGLAFSVLALFGCSTDEFEEDALPEENRMQATLVEPVLECVEELGDDMYEARWSYINGGTSRSKIKIGKRNRFKRSGGKDQGQPTVFKKGYRVDKARTVFEGAGQSPGWRLGKRTVWATQHSRSCSQDRSAFDQLGRSVDENWRLVEPCADLSCGDPCSLCGAGPDENGVICANPLQPMFCDPQGECVGGPMNCGDN